jgi:hypothetical protein
METSHLVNLRAWMIRRAPQLCLVEGERFMRGAEHLGGEMARDEVERLANEAFACAEDRAEAERYVRESRLYGAVEDELDRRHALGLWGRVQAGVANRRFHRDRL